MKKNLFKYPIASLLMAVTVSTELCAQCPLNNITTNPDNTSWTNQPYNFDYKKNSGTNRFDWRQEIIPVSISSFPLSQITSPYYFDATASALKGLAQGEGNPAMYDFYPEDGWELVRKNFGKKADGTLITNEAMIGPYYILYNKYSATLRVIGWTGSAVGYFPTINVKLSFNVDGSTPNVSGLLNQYNVTAMPLDKNSPINHATTPAILTGDVGVPFFADFKLGYDPCTCMFGSNLKIEFEKVQTMDIKLYGRLLATSIPADQYDELVNNDNSMKDRNFLASVFDIDNSSSPNYRSVNAGMLTYRTIDNLIDDYKASSNADWLKEGFDILGKAFQVGSTVADVVRKEDVAKGLEAASALSDFFSGLISPKTMPSVIQGEMALTGQIVNKDDQYVTIPVVNPGSLNSASAPECCTSGTNYFYPMYNEVLGVFALTETPQATTTEWYPDMESSISDRYFQISSPVKYALNPAAKVNLTNSRIYASIELEQTYASSNALSLMNPTTNLFFRHQTTTSNGKTKYVFTSPAVPIESIGNLIIQYKNYFGWTSSLFLSVMLDLEFQGLNKNGIPNKAFTILTYPIESPGLNSGNLSGTFPWAPEFYTLSSSMFISNTTYSAWKDITITGNLSILSGKTVTINAGENVIVNPGVSIGPGAVLKSGIYPIATNNTLVPQTDLTSYCTNGTYKAKSYTQARVAAEDTQEVKVKERGNESLNAYPNPARSKINFQYYLDEASAVRLSIQDLTGRTMAIVVEDYEEAGVYDVPFESQLANGVYIYTLETSKGKQSKRLMIAK